MAPVVMIGSGFEVRGGVSAMAAVCARHGLFDAGRAEYLATHCDGSAARKLGRAARAWLAFAWRLARGRVSLLHAHLNSGASFWRKALFVVPALAARVPYVLHVHCGGFAEFYREGCGRAAKAFVRLLLRRAHAVVALSEEAARELAGIEAGLALHVIPNPVDIPEDAARPGSAPPRVLCLGAVTRAKGVFDLVRAWPRVLAAIPGARLVIAGEGELAAVREEARRGGFEASIETPGWVAGDAKGELLRGAAVFVLPSHREAMPMALLEAMAAGLPAVATRVGAVPSMVAEGESGLTVEVGDEEGLVRALVALLGDPARRSALGAAARERARASFSAEAVVPRIDALWAFPTPAASDGDRQPDGANPRPVGRMDYAGDAARLTGGQVAPPSLRGSRRIHPGASHQ